MKHREARTKPQAASRRPTDPKIRALIRRLNRIQKQLMRQHGARATRDFLGRIARRSAPADSRDPD